MRRKERCKRKKGGQMVAIYLIALLLWGGEMWRLCLKSPKVVSDFQYLACRTNGEKRLLLRETRKVDQPAKRSGREGV